MAGTAVDLTLHPLDTLKTRLQSSAGFWKSGGFRGVYSGIIPAAAASAPSGSHIAIKFVFNYGVIAATFFCTYELTKVLLKRHSSSNLASPFVFMIAATVGEVVSMTSC